METYIVRMMYWDDFNSTLFEKHIYRDIAEVVYYPNYVLLKPADPNMHSIAVRLDDSWKEIKVQLQGD